MQDEFNNRLATASENISALINIFSIPLENIKPLHLRRADKYLAATEEIFDPHFSQRCATAKRLQNAKQTLQRKVQILDKLLVEEQECEKQLTDTANQLRTWQTASQTWKDSFTNAAERAKNYFEAKLYNSELEIIHRYERFQALKGLLPFSDNAQYLCEAIYHYENREKYESNKEKTLERRELAFQRLHNVKRGFYLALLLCIFVVTIPLCAPFAFSLFQRKREIQTQIANLEESLRRENKRIDAADEGVVAAQEIREILGSMSLESVRHTLNEVADLRREFVLGSPKASSTAQLIAFLEQEEGTLQEYFGPVPPQMTEKFHFLIDEAEKLTFLAEKQERLAIMHSNIQLKINRLLNGHTPHLVRDSYQQLCEECALDTINRMPLWLIDEFVDVAIRAPVILGDTRELLWRISKNMITDPAVWKRTELCLKSLQNVLQAAILELSLQKQQDVGTQNLTHPIGPERENLHNTLNHETKDTANS